MSKLQIPKSLMLLSSGVQGCIYEILPRLVDETNSQENLYTFANNMVNTLKGIEYPNGSLMWMLYKDYCNKDLVEFMRCIDTKKKQEDMNSWLQEKLSYYV